MPIPGTRNPEVAGAGLSRYIWYRTRRTRVSQLPMGLGPPFDVTSDRSILVDFERGHFGIAARSHRAPTPPITPALSSRDLKCDTQQASLPLEWHLDRPSALYLQQFCYSLLSYQA